MTARPAANLFEYAERAAQLRDTGMALARIAQDDKAPEWAALAYEAILKAARSKETVHVDDVLAIFKVVPHHPNAWGSVWMRAIKAGVIERTGMVRPCLSDTGKHKHQYPIYRSMVYRA